MHPEIESAEAVSAANLHGSFRSSIAPKVETRAIFDSDSSVHTQFGFEFLRPAADGLKSKFKRAGKMQALQRKP
jgi:hypothetical protein